MGAMEDPTYVSPFVSFLIIAWGLAVICAVAWFFHCAFSSRPILPLPRERRPRPAPRPTTTPPWPPPTPPKGMWLRDPNAPQCRWPHDPKEN